MSDWSAEETDNPLLADDRNFYKVEKWSKDEQRIERMLWAGNSLDQAQVNLQCRGQASAAYPAHDPTANAGAPALAATLIGRPLRSLALHRLALAAFVFAALRVHWLRGAMRTWTSTVLRPS